MAVKPVRPRRPLQRVFALVAAISMVAACGRDGGSPVPVVSTAAASDPAVVTTAAGVVRGAVTPDLRFFGGIPYAAPPVGDLRFALPVPAQPWPGIRDADRPGARCMQDPQGDLEMGRNTSEDCLSLNVWTPAGGQSGARLPVMVWIHGGAFINGSAGIYHAERLVTRGGIIVVTLNYRLGALGFLAHPELGNNFGLADQQLALHWVRDNIAAFGGDPDKVTIAGESAGGMSVCDHLVAPASTGLFRAAIIQSAPCQAQVARPEAEASSLAYARAVGCPDPGRAATCLRALPVDKLRKPVWYYHIGDDALSGPVTGTTLLPLDPMRAIESGSASSLGGIVEANDKLRNEVAVRQRGASVATLEAERLRERLDASLRAVFDYLRDFTTQLNVLKPRVARCYHLLDSDDPIQNLSWEEGYADFRTCSTGEGGFIERVSMGFTLRGPGQRSLERSGGAVERLRQMLFDLGMKYECQERRNRMREVESGLFVVADEVGVQLVWRADFAKGEIVVESRNLERLGFATFTLRPETISPALLDEFGCLVLGRESRFRSLVAR